MKGSSSAWSTPPNARRTGKPSPSKPVGPVVTDLTGRSIVPTAIGSRRGNASVLATVSAGTALRSPGVWVKPPDGRPYSEAPRIRVLTAGGSVIIILADQVDPDAIDRPPRVPTPAHESAVHGATVVEALPGRAHLEPSSRGVLSSHAMDRSTHEGDVLMSEKIGFIGLGTMGAGMASNLIEKGHNVVVWNRTSSRTEPLVQAGASKAASPADVASRCPIVMMCVSDTPDVDAVLHTADGLLAGVTNGSIVIDHSSISPGATVGFAEEVAGLGGSWLDAPVSGGSEGAARGTLSIMVGGGEADIERARPYMEAFGTTITHVGPVGAGQQVKIVNQILVVVTQLAVSEALLFAQASGLDLGATLNAIKGGAAGSWMLANRGPQMIERDWRPGFTIDLQQKAVSYTHLT